MCFFVQKYRLGKSQLSENCSDSKQEGSFDELGPITIQDHEEQFCFVDFYDVFCRLQRHSGGWCAFQCGNQWWNRESD